MSALHSASFFRSWSEGDLITLLSKPTTRAVIADHGFALLQITAPDAELLTLVIDPTRRNRGHGRTLLNRTLDTAIEAGATMLLLEVDAGNRAGRRLYDAAGFQVIATRKAYYAHSDGTCTDALVLRRALVAHPTGT